MDWARELLLNFFWWPWISFFSDLWFLQFCIVYVFYLIVVSSNVYYILLYLFFEIFLFGVFLAVIQMELFTGFLWVAEFTVIFISTILLFYLNSSGYFEKKIKLNYNYYYAGIFLLIFLNYENHSEFESYLPVELNIIDLWDDYYEALYNTNMNDFMGFFVSYYYLNSFEFVLVGVLLLIGSVACVNLFKVNKLNRVAAFDGFFKIFNFFKDFCDYIFLRKQNLNKQNNATSSTRIFKKK